MKCLRTARVFSLCQVCLQPIQGDAHLLQTTKSGQPWITCEAHCPACKPLDERPVETLIGEQASLALT